MEMVKMHVGFPRAPVVSQRRSSKKRGFHLIIILACTNTCRVYFDIFWKIPVYFSISPARVY